MKKTRFVALILGFAICHWDGFSQNFKLQIQPVFSGEEIFLEKTFSSKNGDSMSISTLRFYLGNFEFWKNGQLVFSEKTPRLLDLEDKNSLVLAFNFPEKTTFDSLVFNLGTDSLTNISGAMGGDLDPTRGMFWTWQSGYINFKLEGFSSKCPVRSGNFEFHLGGFLSPFQTVRRVVVPFSKMENARLDFDLASFFQKIDWQKKSSIMSPCAEAARLMDVLANSFQ